MTSTNFPLTILFHKYISPSHIEGLRRTGILGHFQFSGLTPGITPLRMQPQIHPKLTMTF